MTQDEHQLLEIDKEIEDKKRQFSLLEFFLNNDYWLCYIFVFLVFFFLTLYYRFYNNLKLDTGAVFATTLMVAYFSLFLTGLVGFFLGDLINKILYRVFKTNYKDYQKHLLIISQLNKIREPILNRIRLEQKEQRKAQEENFLNRVELFLKQLNGYSITKEFAVFQLYSFKSELKNLNNEALQINSKAYYTDKISLMEEAILDWDNRFSILNKKVLLKESFNNSEKKYFEKKAPIEKNITDNKNTRKKFIPQKEASLAPEEVPDIPIEDLFKNFKKRTTTDKKLDTTNFNDAKTDYKTLNEQKIDLGNLGELFALKWEKERMKRDGLNSFIDKVVHVSEKDDSAGFDILSYNELNEPIFIEVKTTKENQFAPFYLTANELSVINKHNNYWIYRIYNFDIEKASGLVYRIHCNKQLHNHYELKANTFIVTPK